VRCWIVIRQSFTHKEETKMQVHLTLKSANAKTGAIPVSTSSRESCPDTCPLRKAGCYADAGPLALHWNKVTEQQRGTDWQTFCDSIAALPPGQLWRHNQAGDLPHQRGRIDSAALDLLVAANHGKRGFTYTHHDASLNADLLAAANIDGFTVNLSANDLHHADLLAESGLPVVAVLPIEQTSNTKTPAGRAVVVCPATVRDDVNCATCQLCARADRSVIIGFPAHGTSAKKADSVARRVITLKVAA
jgi:hypothetical protein